MLINRPKENGVPDLPRNQIFDLLEGSIRESDQKRETFNLNDARLRNSRSLFRTRFRQMTNGNS